MTTVATNFSGGASILGDTSGNAVPAGYVGEKITWTSAPTNQSTTTSLADWTNASITLTAGVWLVQANVSCIYITGSNLNDSGYTLVKITDSSNNVVENMEKQIAVKTSSAASNWVLTGLPFSFVKSVSGSTTYKIRIAHVISTGTGSGTVYNTTDGKSEFFAIRIA